MTISLIKLSMLHWLVRPGKLQRHYDVHNHRTHGLTPPSLSWTLTTTPTKNLIKMSLPLMSTAMASPDPASHGTIHTIANANWGAEPCSKWRIVVCWDWLFPLFYRDFREILLIFENLRLREAKIQPSGPRTRLLSMWTWMANNFYFGFICPAYAVHDWPDPRDQDSILDSR